MQNPRECFVGCLADGRRRGRLALYVAPGRVEVFDTMAALVDRDPRQQSPQAVPVVQLDATKRANAT